MEACSGDGKGLHRGTGVLALSKRAYDPALSGWGEKRVLVVVVDDAGTAGPAGSDAGGAVATPQPPPHGSDGPRRRLSIWCAGFGPGIPCLSAWGAVKRAAWPSERRWSRLLSPDAEKCQVSGHRPKALPQRRGLLLARKEGTLYAPPCRQTQHHVTGPAGRVGGLQKAHPNQAYESDIHDIHDTFLPMAPSVGAIVDIR